MVGFVPSPVNLETILIRREVQARKAAKALARCMVSFGFGAGLSEISPRDSLSHNPIQNFNQHDVSV